MTKFKKFLYFVNSPGASPVPSNKGTLTKRDNESMKKNILLTTDKTSESDLDTLLKSIAKETLGSSRTDDPRNDIANAKDVINKTEDLDNDCLKNMTLDVPNNQTKAASLTSKPLPIDQLKCNILKGLLLFCLTTI